MEIKKVKSRGAGFNPQNRFEKIYIDYFDEDLENGIEGNEEKRSVPTTFFKDTSKTILAKNDSPDFREFRLLSAG